MSTLLRDYADVLVALRAHVRDNPETSSFTHFYVIRDVAKEMGSLTDDPGAKFEGQVKRGLVALVDEGILVKVKRGERYPMPGHGMVFADEPRYFRAREYPGLVAEAEAMASERVARRDRLAALAVRAREQGLQVAHVVPMGELVGTLTIEPDSLEVLLAAGGEVLT